MSKYTEKIIVGYVAVGPTYRKSLYDNLKNYYEDDDNLYYCVITDNKDYFSDIDRKNLIVNDLNDFFDENDNRRKEYLIRTEDKEEYAQKFREGYRFPFSVYRFLLIQAIELGITNVTMMCTDTKIDFNIFQNEFLEEKNTIYNAISNWYVHRDEKEINKIYPFIKERFNIEVDEQLLVLDAAARFYIGENVEQLKKLFDIWDEVTYHLYETDNMKHFVGGYVINDEYILAPVYNAMKIKHKFNHALFDVKHNAKVERFWT